MNEIGKPRTPPKTLLIDREWLRCEFLKVNPGYSDSTLDTLTGDFSRFLECLLIRWDGTGFNDIMQAVGFTPDSRAMIEHLRSVAVDRRATSERDSFAELVKSTPVFPFQGEPIHEETDYDNFKPEVA